MDRTRITGDKNDNYLDELLESAKTDPGLQPREIDPQPQEENTSEMKIEQIAEIPFPNALGLAFSSDNLFACVDGKKLRIFEMLNNTINWRFTWDRRPARNVAFRHDGKLGIPYGDNVFWYERPFNIHMVGNIKIPEAKAIASGKNIYAMAYRDGILLDFKSCRQRDLDAFAGAKDLSFTEDGSLLAVACEDNHIGFVEVEHDGHTISAIKVKEVSGPGRFDRLALSPDGRYLFTSGNPGLTWKIDLTYNLTICGRVADNVLSVAWGKEYFAVGTESVIKLYTVNG